MNSLHELRQFTKFCNILPMSFRLSLHDSWNSNLIAFSNSCFQHKQAINFYTTQSKNLPLDSPQRFHNLMNSSRCAACRHLRRRCPSDCIFSPYFPSNNPRRFAYVHKIYGASNVGKILQELPANLRAEAADSLYYEAYCRIKDPVYGCVGVITILHQQIYDAQCQLARVQAEIAAVTHQSQQHYHQVEDNLLPVQNGVPNSNSFADPSTWIQ